MGKATLAILFGTLLIAGGGALATWGWNERSSTDTKRMLFERAEAEVSARRTAMLRTLTAEFVFNSNVLKDPQFSETDPEELKKFVVFPKVQATALQSVISSGV